MHYDMRPAERLYARIQVGRDLNQYHDKARREPGPKLEIGF